MTARPHLFLVEDPDSIAGIPDTPRPRELNDEALLDAYSRAVVNAAEMVSESPHAPTTCHPCLPFHTGVSFFTTPNKRAVRFPGEEQRGIEPTPKISAGSAWRQ